MICETLWQLLIGHTAVMSVVWCIFGIHDVSGVLLLATSHYADINISVDIMTIHPMNAVWLTPETSCVAVSVMTAVSTYCQLQTMNSIEWKRHGLCEFEVRSVSQGLRSFPSAFAGQILGGQWSPGYRVLATTTASWLSMCHTITVWLICTDCLTSCRLWSYQSISFN